MRPAVLFVYGTLKRGQPGNRRLAGQRFVREAATGPGFRLADLGRYPGLVPDPAGGAVRGELWEVDAGKLAELDEYEGVPDLYVRGPIAVEGAAGPVETYHYNRPVPPGTRSGSEWPM